MPLYDYRCITCDTVTECLRSVGATWIACPACDSVAEREWPLPVIRGELEPYYDDGLGVRIETRQQRARIMKAQGFVEKGTHTMHGTKGTIFSQPGRATVSVPKSGAYLGPERGR